MQFYKQKMMNKVLLMGFFAVLLFTVKVSAQEKNEVKNQMVLVTTEFGNIKIRLYDATPKHRDNFIKLTEQHFYDSLLFHRVIKSFMIQGGDPKSKTAKQGEMLGNGDVGYTIPAEFVDSLYHRKGVLAAARDNNPQKASSGCQFYIVQGKTFTDAELDMIESRSGKKYTPEQRKVYTTIGGTPHLDGAYTVYGIVTEGLEVVDKIAEVQKDQFDRPLQDIRMKVSLIKIKKKNFFQRLWSKK